MIGSKPSLSALIVADLIPAHAFAGDQAVCAAERDEMADNSPLFRLSPLLGRQKGGDIRHRVDIHRVSLALRLRRGPRGPTAQARETTPACDPDRAD